MMDRKEELKRRIELKRQLVLLTVDEIIQLNKELKAADSVSPEVNSNDR